MDYFVSFLGGLAGSLHCVGMCGAFPLALGGVAAVPRAPCASCVVRRNGLRQILYNLGRLNTLVFIGALSGALGGALVALGPARSIEGWLAIAAGTAMIAIGLEMLGVLAQVSARTAALVQATLGRWLSDVIASPSPLAPVALGVFNAFLPCHLIYAFAARAAATASPPAGALTMLAFGLGTMPAMLAVGLTRSLFPPGLRAQMARVSGLLVLAFGVLTLARGVSGLSSEHGGAHHAVAIDAHALAPAAEIGRAMRAVSAGRSRSRARDRGRL